MIRKEYSIIPGFRITLFYTILYLSIIVILPLSGLFFVASELTFSEFYQKITSRQVVAAYKTSFLSSIIAATISSFAGFIIAWVLCRYNFIGRKLLDSLIDLPFAVPTAVAGIALASLYATDGFIGKFLYDNFGIKVAFTSFGIIIALIFIGLPFIIRTVQPVIEDLDKATEDAAESLGSSRLQTFYKIILPKVFPAILTGFSMAFARGLSEYGSVIFIAGNIPMVSEIVPLVIATKLEQFDYQGAASIAIVMLLTSFILLFVVNMLRSLGGSK
jgi:sulfate/thiosulfate transport system permease protein